MSKRALVIAAIWLGWLLLPVFAICFIDWSFTDWDMTHRGIVLGLWVFTSPIPLMATIWHYEDWS